MQSAFFQRLLLLVVDKIIIGAIVAAAFVVYDQWKTEETRQYDDIRRQVDLEFTRNEHVRQFLPVVLDSSEDSLIRIESLAALVDTMSLSADSQVRLAQRLILDGILTATSIEVTPFSVLNEDFGRTLRRTPYRGPEADLLAELLDSTMPSGLTTVVSAYEGVGLELDTLAEDNRADQVVRRERLEDARQFWVRIFLDTVAASDDSALTPLDAERFRVRNLRVIDDLAKRISDAEAAQWFEKTSSVIRTIGAVGLACRGGGGSVAPSANVREVNVDSGPGFPSCDDLASGASSDTAVRYRDAVAYLVQLVESASTEEDLRFAAALVDVVRLRLIHAPELVNTVLDSAISHRHQPTTTTAGRRLSEEFSDYLYWGVLDSDVAEMIVPRVADEVRHFVERTARVPLDSLGDRDQYRVDQVMVRILSNVTSRTPSARQQAQEVLANLYAVGREKLLVMGFGDFVLDWERARGSQ